MKKRRSILLGANLILHRRRRGGAGILLGFFLLTAYQPAAFSTESRAYFPASDQRPTQLHVGEKFVYNIYYLGMIVGEAKAEVKELIQFRGRKAYHIEVQVRSRSVIDYLYRVRDTHHSYVDAEHFHSLYYEKELNEGRYHVHEKMIFDQEKHEAEYHSLTNGTRKMMLIPKNVQDQVSAGFWFRMQDIKPNSQITVPVNADEKNWDLQVDIGEVEKIKLKDLGEYDAVKLVPQIKFQGLFVRRGRIDGWLGLDALKTPLTMRVKVPILGSVSIKLVEYHQGRSQV